MRRIFRTLLVLILILCIPIFAFAEPETSADTSTEDTDTLLDQTPIFNEGKVDATAVMLIDARTGLVMYQKNAEQSIYPASTTKIMTCLIVLEQSEMSDMVTVGQEVVFSSEYSVMGLKPGEIVSVRDLIYGMMLVSGNDAAAALAVYIGGSIDGFSDMMNEKAEALGMSNTHFANPHGAHDDNHFTTAEDMAKLAMATYNNPDFMSIVGTKVYQPEDTNMATEKEVLDNSNRLIRSDVNSYAKWYNEYATGMKTGYTSQAGYCLVASTSKNGQDLIALIFDHESTNDRFALANDLFSFGYENYAQVDLSEVLGTQVVREAITNATADDANGGFMEFIPEIEVDTFFTATNAYISSLRENANDIQAMVDLDADLRAPILKGEVYGKVIYQYGDRILLRCNLMAAYDMLDYATDYLTFQEEDPNVSIAPPTDLNSGTTPAWWWMIFPSALILLITYRLLTYKRTKYKRSKNKHKYGDYQA
ncbi:MAG: D-alanyl-D-alanine carboxypeptidase family protein [Eubacteriales bacterium]